MDDRVEALWLHHQELVNQHVKLRGQFDAAVLVLGHMLRHVPLPERDITNLRAALDVAQETLLASPSPTAAIHAEGFNYSADALFRQLQSVTTSRGSSDT